MIDTREDKQVPVTEKSTKEEELSGSEVMELKMESKRERER